MAIKIPSSARRYAVSDRPRMGLSELCERLAKRRFLPLTDAVEEEERAGWITCEHLLDTRFDLEVCVREPYIVFALRVDRRRVPAALLRAHLCIEENAHKVATGKRMTPTERRDARDAIKLRMIPQVLPTPQSYPVIWSPERRRVYFGSTGAHPNDLFRAHFEDTFGLELTALSPLGAAEALAAGRPELLRELALLTPTQFEGKVGQRAPGGAAVTLVA